MIKKYKKKPVVIEALLWDGNNNDEVELWLDIPNSEHSIQISSYTKNEDRVLIKTLEGTMAANIGDFIIKGIQGEFYPCKPDIFEKTYEEVL